MATSITRKNVISCHWASHLITVCNEQVEFLLQILCGKELPSWINRLAYVSSCIPFIEKAIPKEWLTPLALQSAIDSSTSEDNSEHNHLFTPAEPPASMARSSPAAVRKTLASRFLGPDSRLTWESNQEIAATARLNNSIRQFIFFIKSVSYFCLHFRCFTRCYRLLLLLL